LGSIINQNSQNKKSYEVNLASQSSNFEVLLQSKFWSQRGDPHGYKLSCCGSFGRVFFSFIQIDFGHAVKGAKNIFTL
jgi:hypothetical protein